MNRALSIKLLVNLFWYMNSFIGQVHGDSFPCFLRSLSFPSYTRYFHSLAGMIRGCSYLGFLSRWTRYWSQTIFICCPTFFMTMALLNVSLSNMPTNRLVRSYFEFFWMLIPPYGDRGPQDIHGQIIYMFIKKIISCKIIMESLFERQCFIGILQQIINTSLNNA